MKFLEKLALILFSLIISIIALILILIMLNILKIEAVLYVIALAVKSEIAIRSIFISAVIILVLALKCLFFRAKPQDDGRNGITLENDSGKLVISKESMETLIANVVKEVPGIEAVASRTILDSNNNVNVYVTTLVAKDMIIKDVSAEIQNRIKDTLKKTADLEVKQVNIKVKNITNKKVKELMPPEEKEE